jgi:hypothetical protein
MPSDIVNLPATEAKALKQLLNTLVVMAEVVEEKAITTRCCVLATCQLLDEEHATTTDLEWQANAAKKLVPGSASSSTMEPAIISLSYEDIIVANLHIQAVAVPNICSLVNIVLDVTSDNYA